MAEEHDVWMLGLGVDINQLRQNAIDAVSSATQTVSDATPAVVQTVSDTATLVEQGVAAAIPNIVQAASDVVPAIVQTVVDTASSVVQVVSDIEPDLTQGGVDVRNSTPTLLADDSGATANQADAGASDAGAAADPTFVHHEKTITIRTDSASDFIRQAAQKQAEAHVVGHMDPGVIKPNYETDSKGHVTRVNLKITSEIVRPAWGGGRPIGNEADVIRQAEQLILEHETRHRQILENNMTRAVAEMRGKTVNEADKILTRWIKTMESEQNALDAREGLITVDAADGRELRARLAPLH